MKHARTLEWQIKNGNPNTYCDTCGWSNSGDAKKYPYCPYGHGAMSPIGEYVSKESALRAILEEV